MRSNVVLLVCLVVFAQGQVLGRQLRTLKIKNENRGDEIVVSWGYNYQQLKLFIVSIPPQSSLEIRNWDVDKPTNLFVYDAGDPYFQTSHKSLQGYMYGMPLGREINVKYSTEKGLHSNAFFGLSDRDIFTRCQDEKFKSLSQCRQPKTETIQWGMDRPARFSSKKTVSPEESRMGRQNRDALQKFIDKMGQKF